ncbi:MAG: MFS transporter [Rhodocyclaceae bacterium]|nr:MFS transporter [Rhodocyclaceae bacterium]
MSREIGPNMNPLSPSDNVPTPQGWYRWYVLAVLMVIYAINFIDRQIVTILAPYLKADLTLTDAQIGLLYGTAFATFYALFGIPLAKLADGWSRAKTLAISLFSWSALTAASGLSQNFAQLGAARLGVGIGEASSSPAAISLLSDYFPRQMRASVFALYAMGMYAGLGASLMIGGTIVAKWNGQFGLSGWQAAYIIIGLPGLVLGLLVYLTIREPVRGALDGHPHPGSPHPFHDALLEAATMFPPFSIWMLRRSGGNASTLKINIIGLLLILIGAAAIDYMTGSLLSPAKRALLFSMGPVDVSTNMVQWFAFAVGIYAALSWIQSVKLRDPVAFSLTVGGSAYRYMVAACSLLGVFTYAIGAFVFLYGSQSLGLGPKSGFTLGLIAAVAGGLGAGLGGIAGDWLKRRNAAGRIWFLIVALIGFSGATMIQFNTTDPEIFFTAYGVALLLMSTWAPIMLATAQDLVIPSLRGVGFAVHSLSTGLIGLGLGPYVVGFVSDVTGDLRFALLSLFALMPILLGVLWRLAILLPADESSVVHRAEQAKARNPIGR